MRVCAIGDIGDDDAGVVGERLVELGGELTTRWRDDPALLEGLERDCDLLLLLGSDRSVHSPDDPLVVEAEQQLYHRAVARGLPVIAICYGAQLVASALGAEVRRAPEPEIGWHTIDPHEAAGIGTGPFFQYHYDQFSPPPAATLLASNAHSPQAFESGRTLAMQFHPEVTFEIVERWLLSGREELAPYDVDVDALLAASSYEIEASRSRCHAIVDHFLSHIARRPLA